jgi:hypothetical protein
VRDVVVTRVEIRGPPHGRRDAGHQWDGPWSAGGARGETIREGLTWELEPDVMLDLGEQFLLLGRLRVSGPESQIELGGSFAQLLTIAGGLIAREQDFRSWDEGLRAAGLDRSSIALPHRQEPP